jgi:predicted enzyme related to lactoylglutathione lyase
VPCVDYAASVEFYQKLNLRLIVDSPPRYARFESTSGSTLSIHAVDTAPESSGVTIYFEVDDVDATVRELKGNGLEFDAEPVDQPWLWREAYLLTLSPSTSPGYGARPI